jgi:serine/threonine protein kinase
VEALLGAYTDAGTFGEPARLASTDSARRLPAGTILGRYRLEQWIGAGGMGEVYRARDTRPGRDVPIKILPAHFTADPERRARFGREARLPATLNDPHIGAIYRLEADSQLEAPWNDARIRVVRFRERSVESE